MHFLRLSLADVANLSGLVRETSPNSSQETVWDVA